MGWRSVRPGRRPSQALQAFNILVRQEVPIAISTSLGHQGAAPRRPGRGSSGAPPRPLGGETRQPQARCDAFLPALALKLARGPLSSGPSLVDVDQGMSWRRAPS